MGIYKKGSVWWCIKQCNGRKVEISLKTSIKRLAEKRFAEILPAIVDGSYFKEPARIPTVQEVMERYMREASPQQLGHDRNQAVHAYWLEFFGRDLLMSEVTRSLISSYKAGRLNGEIMHGKRKAGEATVKKELSLLRQVINHAVNEWEDDWGGYFLHYVNPVKRVIRGMKEAKRIRYLTEDEASALAKTLPTWLFDIVVVSCETGLRRGKVVGLLKSQLDFNAGWINIPQKNSREKSARPVKMTGVLRAFLKEVLKRSDPGSPYLFSDGNGKPYSQARVSMAFRRACQAANISDLRLHDLRHDFATRLINSGASLYQVQHQLAHSDPRITQRYAHLLPENQNVVDRIDGTGTTTVLLQSKKKELPVSGNSLD